MLFVAKRKISITDFCTGFPFASSLFYASSSLSASTPWSSFSASKGKSVTAKVHSGACCEHHETVLWVRKGRKEASITPSMPDMEAIKYQHGLFYVTGKTEHRQGRSRDAKQKKGGKKGVSQLLDAWTLHAGCWTLKMFANMHVKISQTFTVTHAQVNAVGRKVHEKPLSWFLQLIFNQSVKQQ